MTENRKVLDASDLDGFDKRKFPSPGFQVEIVMIDFDGTLPTNSKADSSTEKSDGSSSCGPDSSGVIEANSSRSKAAQNEDNDDVFSDSEGEETGASKSQQPRASSKTEPAGLDHASKATPQEVKNLAHGTGQMTLSSSKKHPQIDGQQEPTVDGVKKPVAIGHETANLDSVGVKDIKAIAADASVFTFGDEEDFESE